MSAPTREQVIELAKEAGIEVPAIAFDSEKITLEFRQLWIFAMAAIAVDREEAMKRSRSIIVQAEERGREQGLREAKEVCEQNAKRWPDLRGFYVANECAAAIEQLRAPRAT